MFFLILRRLDRPILFWLGGVGAVFVEGIYRLYSLAACILEKHGDVLWGGAAV